MHNAPGGRDLQHALSDYLKAQLKPRRAGAAESRRGVLCMREHRDIAGDGTVAQYLREAAFAMVSAACTVDVLRNADAT